MRESKNTYLKLTIARAVFIVGILIPCCLCALVPENDRNIPLYVGVAVEIIGIIYSLIFVRCPSCNHCIAFVYWGTDCCPKCGEEIE